MPEAVQFAGEAKISKEVVFTCDHAAMIAARDSVVDLVREYCEGEQEEIDIFLALQEALANAVVHGCQGDPSKSIHCRIGVDADAITIVIRDPGRGFDVAAIDAAGTNLSEHGRGISLMRGLMDEVTYLRGGSEVRLRKLRPKRITEAESSVKSTPSENRPL